MRWNALSIRLHNLVSRTESHVRAWQGRLLAREKDAAYLQLIQSVSALQDAGIPLGFRFCRRPPDLPFLYTCAGTESGEETGLGFDFSSEEIAFAKAVGETLERHVWLDPTTFHHHTIQRARARDVEGALVLEHLAGFTKEARAADKRLQYDATTLFAWVTSDPLTKNGASHVPLQMVSHAHAADVLRGVVHEPLLRQVTTNGIAAYTDRATARYRALLEIIERDAFMITYFNMISAPRIDPHSLSDPRLTHLRAEFARYGIACETVLLPTDMPVYVACTVLRDTLGRGPALALGACAHADASEATLRSMAEALAIMTRMHQSGIANIQPKDGPWDITDRLAFWSEHKNLPLFAWFTEGPLVTMPTTQKEGTKLDALLRALEEKNYTASAVRMSSKLLEDNGFFVEYVVCPELQPIDLSSDLPYTGGERLSKIPRAFGYDPRTTPPPHPHPFP